jgi:DNA-binding response OmpR family regulator
VENGVVMIIMQAEKRWSEEKIQAAFTTAGYGVMLAAREAAENAILQSKPVLIIADLGEEGISDLVFYRQMVALSAAPLIVIGCAEDAAMSTAILDAGADDCLTQPVSPQELVARASNILRRRSYPGPNHPAGKRPGNPVSAALPEGKLVWSARLPRWLRQFYKRMHKDDTKSSTAGKKE